MISDRVKATYDWFKSREQELLHEAERNDGKLARHDLWRLEYYRQPYLLLEPAEIIAERFRDVFTNSIYITEKGQIGITGFNADDHCLGQLFTELIEETNWRGILTQESQKEAHSQIQSYFDEGTPLGVRMFADVQLPLDGYLLKFSREEFVADMLNYGRFRISPASYYSKGSHIRAVKDLETIRPYKIVAIEEAIKGNTHIQFQGREIPIVHGVIPLRFEMDDYYLFSTCSTISRRMPTDFEADAVLIIRDKNEFITRFREAVLGFLPGWEFKEGVVYYYDPYKDKPSGIDQEFYKHLSYTYQKEHRCILRRSGESKPRESLEPFFVELGTLDDIAEMVCIPK